MKCILPVPYSLAFDVYFSAMSDLFRFADYGEVQPQFD